MQSRVGRVPRTRPTRICQTKSVGEALILWWYQDHISKLFISLIYDICEMSH